MWRLSCKLGWLAGIGAIALATSRPGYGVEGLDPRTVDRVKTASDVALRAVRFQQSKDGSYGDPLTTALVVRAFMDSPRRYTEEDGPFVARPLAALELEGRDPRQAETWAALALAARRSPSPAREEALAWRDRLREASAAGTDRPSADTLAFAAEALASAGVSLDEDFSSDGTPGGAASDYVAVLRSGAAAPRSLAARCSTTASRREQYFVAATLAALASHPTTRDEVPAACARELAGAVLASQRADGLWEPADDGDGPPLRATAFALLALAKLGAI